MCLKENELQAIGTIKKIENRISTLQNFRLFILNINKIDEWKNERKEIIKYFFELEHELIQFNNSLKSFLSEKQELLEKLESTNLKYKQIQTEHINYEKDLEDLNKKIQDLIYINRTLNNKVNIEEYDISLLKEGIKINEDRNKRIQLEFENNDITNKISNYNLRPDYNLEIPNYISNQKEILNNVITDYLTPNFNRKTYKNKMKDDYQKTIQSQATINNLQKSTYKKENKIEKLVGLLVKIKNSDQLKKYCLEKLNKDFMQKLLSEKVSEGFIEKVECVIDEFHRLYYSENTLTDNLMKVNNKTNDHSTFYLKDEKSTNRSSFFKFSKSELKDNKDLVKSNRCLKSSLSSLSKINKKSNKVDKNRNNQSRNNLNKLIDCRESSSWNSRKDHYASQNGTNRNNLK